MSSRLAPWKFDVEQRFIGQQQDQIHLAFLYARQLHVERLFDRDAGGKLHDQARLLLFEELFERSVELKAVSHRS